jgi:protein subunit release factor B
MELKPEDLTVDTYHAERVGGWSTAQPIAVRIMHNPTGISVSKSDDRSVHRNKANAYADLCEAVAKYYKAACFTGSNPIAQTQVKLYACHDQPRPVAGAITHYAQDEYEYTELTESGRMQRHAVA